MIGNVEFFAQNFQSLSRVMESDENVIKHH